MIEFRLVSRNTRWERKCMINIEYFVNKVKAEREAAAARLAHKSPVLPCNGKFTDLPEAAASAAPLTRVVSAEQMRKSSVPRIKRGPQLTTSPGLL
jgi:hypothetical protein